MIGEMRDLETIEIAVRAALTGHLVLSTLHTNDAPSTITRLIDMGVDPFLVCSTVVLVAAQRLLRKLCNDCKAPVEVKKERLKEVGFTDEDIDGGATMFQAVGCPRCAQGYNGRFAVLETMPMVEELRRRVLDGANEIVVRDAAIEGGMISLRRCGLLNVMRGRTSIEEVFRVTATEQ
jgi:type IV pilus assembly protein PilB